VKRENVKFTDEELSNRDSGMGTDQERYGKSQEISLGRSGRGGNSGGEKVDQGSQEGGELWSISVNIGKFAVLPKGRGSHITPEGTEEDTLPYGGALFKRRTGRAGTKLTRLGEEVGRRIPLHPRLFKRIRHNEKERAIKKNEDKAGAGGGGSRTTSMRFPRETDCS